MYYFIINPKSQSGKSYELWKQIKAELETKKAVCSYVKSVAQVGISQTISKEYQKMFPEYRYVYTRYPGHMTEIVRRLSSSLRPKHIIIIGGDGSFSEAVNGLQNSHIHKLSFFPAGSANDLSRSLALPENATLLLERILKQPDALGTHMDIGTVSFFRNGEQKRRHFVVSSGAGLDAAICQNMNTSRMKNLFNRIHIGSIAYLILGIKQLFCWKPQRAFLWIDNAKKPVLLERFLFISAHIHPYEGGGFPFCPNADYQDGKLDLCIVSGLPLRKIFPLIPLAKQGRHVGQKGVWNLRCKKVRIALEHPVFIHTDGEIPAKTKEFTFESGDTGYSFL